MSTDPQQSSPRGSRESNRLIERLPRSQRSAVLAVCDAVNLDPGVIVCEAGAPFRHVYFPLSGAISMEGRISDRDAYEISSVGREGIVGIGLIFGINRSVQQGIVRVPCRTLRITTRKMRQAIKTHPAFRGILQSHLYEAIAEMSQTVGCVQFHDVSRRLARTLLVAHDRVPDDTLRMLTHKLLADMLGVQRGSVTIAAAQLQKSGAIRYRRGTIVVLDRDALEASACDCHRPGERVLHTTGS